VSASRPTTWRDGHGVERPLYDVFISYGRADLQEVRMIAEGLEREGVSVALDVAIPPGVSFTRYLQDVLKNSRLALVVWSESAAESDWVVSEAEYARVRRRLVSCRVDHCLLSPPFNSFQTADLSRWRGDPSAEEWRQVVDLISFRVKGSTAASGMGEASPE
jgi:hypothetical protein